MGNWINVDITVAFIRNTQIELAERKVNHDEKRTRAPRDGYPYSASRTAA